MRSELVASFLAVLDHGGYQLAAEAVGDSASSLHKDVRNLERQLGVTLFVPVGRQVRPSVDAVHLEPFCRMFLASAADIERRAEQMRGGVAGVVRIACATTHIARFLAAAKQQFVERYPDVDVQFLPISADIDWNPLETISKVVHGEADLAVGRDRDASMESAELWDSRVVVVTADSHPFRFRQSIPVTEIIDMPLMVAGPNHGSRRYLEVEAARAGRRLSISLEALPDVLRSAAMVGLGVAVFGDDALLPPPETPYPLLVDEHGDAMLNQVSLHWSRGRAPSPTVRTFVDFVLAERASIDGRSLGLTGE